MTAVTRESVRHGQPVIERASPSDRAFFAMDSGEVPEQFGVILLLEEGGGLDLDRARRLIAERVPAVPRLRQRLIRVPLGCGGPIWVDDRDSTSAAMSARWPAASRATSRRCWTPLCP